MANSLANDSDITVFAFEVTGLDVWFEFAVYD